MTAAVLTEPAHLFTIRPATAYRRRLLHNLGIKAFRGENPPYGASIYLLLARNAQGNAERGHHRCGGQASHRIAWTEGRRTAAHRVASGPGRHPCERLQAGPERHVHGDRDVDGVVLRQPVHVRADE